MKSLEISSHVFVRKYAFGAVGRSVMLKVLGVFKKEFDEKYLKLAVSFTEFKVLNVPVTAYLLLLLLLAFCIVTLSEPLQ